MLVCMDPSSPPVKRTLHLLKTPDILLANDKARGDGDLFGAVGVPVQSGFGDEQLGRGAALVAQGLGARDQLAKGRASGVDAAAHARGRAVLAEDVTQGAGPLAGRAAGLR